MHLGIFDQNKSNLHPNQSILLDYLFLILFGLAFCVYGIGRGSLASWDEAMYAQVAKEIAYTGDWINLKYLGMDWYVKPPLSLWATAVFFKLGGVNEFTSRLFSGLMGVASVAALYRVGLLFFDRRAAFLAAGFLLSTTDFLHFARWAVTDVPNLFFFTAAILCFFRAKANGAWFIGFGAALAGGVMTKGPVVALAAAAVFFHALWERDLSFLTKKMFWLGLFAGVLLALPWHLAAYFHDPRQFTEDFIRLHWFSRAASALDGHSQNYYFYIRTIINKYHPWVILLPLSLAASVWKAVKSPSTEFIPSAVEGLRARAGHRLIVVWTLTVLCFFTFLAQTKLRWYILPAYPALSLSAGVLAAGLLKGKWAALAKPAVALALVLHFPFSDVMVQDYSPGIKAVAPAIKDRLAPGETAYFYRFHEDPAGTFYTDRPVQYLESAEDLDKALAEKGKLLILIPEEAFRDDGKAIQARGFSILRQTDGMKQNVFLLSN